MPEPIVSLSRTVIVVPAGITTGFGLNNEEEPDEVDFDCAEVPGDPPPGFVPLDASGSAPLFAQPMGQVIKTAVAANSNSFRAIYFLFPS